MLLTSRRSTSHRSDHLASWARCVVATVTAGRHRLAIDAVGEMIRMAGVPLVSAVLLGADAADESLGATSTARGAANGWVTAAG